jgi:hypothetical protein
MSETETTVPMDSKALFDAAISDAAPETVTETPAATEQADAGPARDEQGRFAPKAEQEAAPAATEQPAPVVETTPAPVEARQEPPPGWIPAWRAREIADARAREVEARYAKQTPQEPLDPYLDPEKFRDAGVKQAIDPVQQRMDALREHYSWKDAVRSYGQETAVEARKWFYEAVHAGDPNVAPVLQKALASIDPFEDIVTAYKQHKTLTTIGTDANAWFDKELERRLADPAFAAKLQPAQAAAQSDPKTVVRMPPSLNRQPGSAAADSGSMNSADLYNYAIS